MPAISHADRRLFRLIRIGRGQSLRVTTTGDISLANVHWTTEGPRPCSGDPNNCQHCANANASRPRETLYIAAYEEGARSPGLLIISTLAVPWATDTDDLARIEMTIERAKANNLLRARHDGPAKRATQPAPLDRWLATLWGAR